ncbi:MAG TPA: hypothetical protein VFU15_15805, partial [Bacteroidia bacterium]|nr:hypothetical protein [Bacteroidia bacterium]
LLLIAYIAMGWFFRMVFIARKEKKNTSATISFLLKHLRYPLIAAVAGYFLGMIFWPYGLTNPFTHPFIALSEFSNYDKFDSYNLFEGRWIHRWEIPWNYIPEWIWITTPLFINLIFIFIPLSFFKKLTGTISICRGYLALVCFVAAFPVFYIIYRHSNVYDGWRHAFFVYPSFAAACAVTWTTVIQIVKPKFYRYAIVAILAGTMIQPAAWMIRNHPFESFYFSPVIGGTKGAFKKFEIDYYGTSYRQAVEWIASHADTTGKGPARVRCYYGETESSKHFVDKYKNLRYVFANENSLDWDYSIVLPCQAKLDSMLLVNWPPQGTVWQAYADSTPIVAVVKNFRTKDMLPDPRTSVYSSTDVNYLLNMSLSFYNAGDYFSCIAACERALQFDPGNMIAYNNKCTALNRLLLYPDALEAGAAGLAVDSSYALLKGNVKEAQQGMNAKPDPGILAANYLNLSVVYYNLGLYRKTIELCKKALRYDPQSAIAYNNICSSYNALGEYRSADSACSKGLSIDPKNALLQNNLGEAKKHEGK